MTDQKPAADLIKLAVALGNAHRPGESMDICNKIIEWSRKNADLCATVCGTYTNEELRLYDFMRKLDDTEDHVQFRITQDAIDALEAFAEIRREFPDRSKRRQVAPNAILDIVKGLLIRRYAFKLGFLRPDQPIPVLPPETSSEFVPAAPEGYALVPIEPTELMLEAYFAQSGESHKMKERVFDSARGRWRVMVEAAILGVTPK